MSTSVSETIPALSGLNRNRHRWLPPHACTGRKALTTWPIRRERQVGRHTHLSNITVEPGSRHSSHKIFTENIRNIWSQYYLVYKRYLHLGTNIYLIRATENMSLLRTCREPGRPRERNANKNRGSGSATNNRPSKHPCTFVLRHRIASNQCLMLSSCVVETQERSDFISGPPDSLWCEGSVTVG